MPTVADVDAVKIQFYPDEHPSPHFHVEYAEFRGAIDIATLELIKGSLPPAKLRSVRKWAASRREILTETFARDSERAAGAIGMNEILPRIKAVEPVIYGVIKLVFDDGYEGVVDLRPVIAQGEIFGYFHRNPENFKKVAVSEYGHSIYWVDDTGYEIDFGADRLREKAERQAELHRQMAV